MTRAFRDAPPDAPTVTDYDRSHAALYLRLLDAEAAGADWKEVVALLFSLDPLTAPEHARRVHAAHLARARWMSAEGYQQLLRRPDK
ncbi:DNA -binding domain-containing protein [Ancylobacter polymorphus]|uniref:T6SS Transcription factor RovC-like DNA binding domain-containing protein n=1 Tax=Ancylobacter polymorphus TaxID=223390 RepID=A0ABU0B9G2_9HYPH|nr:DUF2285 domain-containing protein [Ancylobacter polymorphus]MDQ0302461.1 hypothetical protein [Ancylobacter polymorphus]